MIRRGRGMQSKVKEQRLTQPLHLLQPLQQMHPLPKKPPTQNAGGPSVKLSQGLHEYVHEILGRVQSVLRRCLFPERYGFGLCVSRW